MKKDLESRLMALEGRVLAGPAAPLDDLEDDPPPPELPKVRARIEELCDYDLSREAVEARVERRRADYRTFEAELAPYRRRDWNQFLKPYEREFRTTLRSAITASMESGFQLPIVERIKRIPPWRELMPKFRAHMEAQRRNLGAEAGR